MYPENFKYSKEHEWVSVEGDIATVGITAFATESLGDIVYVEIPEADTEVSKDEECGSIESVKAVSDLFCPLSGVVVEANEALEDAPETVNDDPHGAGWIFKLKMSDPSELDDLMDAEAYQAFIASEQE